MRHFEFPLFFFLFFVFSFLTVRISHYEYWSHSFQTAHIDSSRTAVFLVVLFERPGWWKWPANTWICTFDSLCASDGKKVTSVESSSELTAPLLNCREKVRTFFLKAFLTFRESNNRMRSTFLLNTERLRVSQQVLYGFYFYLCPAVSVLTHPPAGFIFFSVSEIRGWFWANPRQVLGNLQLLSPNLLTS